MKTHRYIRRQRRLEGQGDSLLLGRLTQQAHTLHQGAHGALHRFVNRITGRHETFLRLIRSRVEVTEKYRTALQFEFRLPFYIQNIENKTSVQPIVYSTLFKNRYQLTKSEIRYYISKQSKQIYQFNATEYNNKYAIIDKIFTSYKNKSTSTTFIKNALSNFYMIYHVQNAKDKSISYQKMQYHFALSEGLTHIHYLSPNHAFETSQSQFLKETRFDDHSVMPYRRRHRSTPYGQDREPVRSHTLSQMRLDQRFIRTQQLSAHVARQQRPVHAAEPRITHKRLLDMPREAARKAPNAWPVSWQWTATPLGIATLPLTSYRGLVSLLPRSQMHLDQRILRLPVGQGGREQTEIRRLWHQTARLPHALPAAFFTQQLSVHAARQQRAVHAAAPQITHKQLMGITQETAGKAPNAWPVSWQRTAMPLGIAAPPQTPYRDLVETREPWRQTARLSHALPAAFFAPQPGAHVARQQRPVHVAEPQITHKRLMGMRQGPQEAAEQAPNEPVVSRQRTATPLGIAAPPQAYMPFDMDDLTNQIIQKIEDRLKTEQERRGIFV